MTIIRRYSELIKLQTFEERFDYLKIPGKIGVETFGFDRYINQVFYSSDRWKAARREVIIRDKGFDLGIKDREILTNVHVHHMNPISVRDIEEDSPWLYDEEFLISASEFTHKAIHFGNKNMLMLNVITRKENDTIPWK